MSHEAGKGSRPRPFSVAQEDYNARWDMIFGRDLKKNEERAEPSKEQHVLENNGDVAQR